MLLVVAVPRTPVHKVVQQWREDRIYAVSRPAGKPGCAAGRSALAWSHDLLMFLSRAPSVWPCHRGPASALQYLTADALGLVSPVGVAPGRRAVPLPLQRRTRRPDGRTTRTSGPVRGCRIASTQSPRTPRKKRGSGPPGRQIRHITPVRPGSALPAVLHPPPQRLRLRVVADAVARAERENSLAELLAELDRELGGSSAEARAWADHELRRAGLIR